MAVSTIDALYSAGIVNLDSSFSSGTTGGIIRLNDAGTQFGDLYEDSGNFIIASAQVDKDIIFKGNDGGGIITAMTIDMSAGGNVGIGTTSPTLPLDIVSNGAADALKIRARPTSDDYGTLTFYNNAGTTKWADIQSNVAKDLRFYTNGGTEAMRIDSSGAVTKPAQPAFLAFPTSGTQNNIAVNTDVTVVLANEVFDQNNDFAGSQFTAPVTGKYQLNAALRLQNMDVLASYYQMHIKTSNRIYRSIISMDGFDSNIALFTMEVSSLCDMDANDTAYISIHQSGGSSVTDLHSESQFSGHLVA